MRSPTSRCPLGLFCIGRSLLSILGAAPEPKQPKSSSATQSGQPTSRCRSTATGSAASGFIFLQLLGLGSAEEFDTSELPSATSTLSVLAIALAAGLVTFGEASLSLLFTIVLSLPLCLCLVFCHWLVFCQILSLSVPPISVSTPLFLPLCSLPASQVHPTLSDSLSAAQTMLICVACRCPVHGECCRGNSC